MSIITMVIKAPAPVASQVAIWRVMSRKLEGNAQYGVHWQDAGSSRGPIHLLYLRRKRAGGNARRTAIRLDSKTHGGIPKGGGGMLVLRGTSLSFTFRRDVTFFRL